MKSGADSQIEKAINSSDWAGARKLIEIELAQNPNNHWLLSQLALTFYEQRDYEQALRLDIRALNEAPYCPLAIWGYAGTLDMLGRQNEARKLYRWLISWGEEELAYGECGEGIRRARALIADCHYRIASIWEDKGQRKRALASYAEYLAKRALGHGSIYSLRDAKVRYKNLSGSK